MSQVLYIYVLSVDTPAIGIHNNRWWLLSFSTMVFCGDCYSKSAKLATEKNKFCPIKNKYIMIEYIGNICTAFYPQSFVILTSEAISVCWFLVKPFVFFNILFEIFSYMLWIILLLFCTGYHHIFLNYFSTGEKIIIPTVGVLQCYNFSDSETFLL